LLLSLEPGAEGLALDVRHGEPQLACRGYTRVVNGYDVWVLEAGGELDLSREAFGADGGPKVGAQHLDGNEPFVAQVAGEVHRGHSTASELPLDGVVRAECGLELVAFRRRRHPDPRLG
jgi:hypothetical protein